MHTIKYRLSEERLRPRRTKLEIPGWAGKPEPRADGSHEYAWHCVPFSEAAQYGLEVFYPYDNELHVSIKDGHLVFDGDFGPAPRRRPDVAAVQDLRRTILYLSATSRLKGQSRACG